MSLAGYHNKWKFAEEDTINGYSKYRNDSPNAEPISEMIPSEIGAQDAGKEDTLEKISKRKFGLVSLYIFLRDCTGHGLKHISQTLNQ